MKFYEVVEVIGGDEFKYLRTYDKDEALAYVRNERGLEPSKTEVREYTLPHQVNNLKEFDNPYSNFYDESIDVSAIFGFYNLIEIE